LRALALVPIYVRVCVTRRRRVCRNADTAATALAMQLNADKLVFLSDVPGVLRDPTDVTSLISSLTVSEAQALIDDGTISGGMIPKVLACMETVSRGVHKVHIIDGRLRHGLLMEIYTTVGTGTVITADSTS